MSSVETLKVLDHGYITLIEKMGSDERIIEAARMSTGKGFISWDPYWRCKKCGTVVTPQLANAQVPACEINKQGGCDYEKFPRGDLGLLDTLWRNKHTSPFEMCEIVFEVQAPLFVVREWERHRTQSYNEFSARYAQMPDLHYVPEKRRIQTQHTTNKQASGGSVDEEVAQSFIDECTVDQERLYVQYEEWLDLGIAKELARINTPSSRYTKFRAKANLLNWFRFLNLRMRPNAQEEIRVYAKAMCMLVKAAFPRSFALFMEYDLYSASFGAREMGLLRDILFPDTSKLDLFFESEDAKKAESILGKTRFEEFKRKLTFGGMDIL